MKKYILAIAFFSLIILTTNAESQPTSYSVKYFVAPADAVTATLVKLTDHGTLPSNILDGMTSVAGVNTCNTIPMTLTSKQINKGKTYIDALLTATASVNGKTITNTIHLKLHPQNTEKPWTMNPQTGDNTNLLSVGTKNVLGVGVPNDSTQPNAGTFEAVDQYDIALMDYNKTYNNMLFRGNEPLNLVTSPNDKQKVDFSSLISFFSNRASEANIENFPTEFNFYDVCLLYDTITPGVPASEGNALYIEYCAFTDNPASKSTFTDNPTNSIPSNNKTLKCTNFPLSGGYKIVNNGTTIHGTLLWWPGVGYVPSGGQAAETTCVENLVAKLQTLINTKAANGFPNIVYVHCMNGHDRTGDVMVSYMYTQYGKKGTFGLSEAYQYGTFMNTTPITPLKDPYLNDVIIYAGENSNSNLIVNSSATEVWKNHTPTPTPYGPDPALGASASHGGESLGDL